MGKAAGWVFSVGLPGASQPAIETRAALDESNKDSTIKMCIEKRAANIMLGQVQPTNNDRILLSERAPISYVGTTVGDLPSTVLWQGVFVNELSTSRVQNAVAAGVNGAISKTEALKAGCGA